MSEEGRMVSSGDVDRLTVEVMAAVAHIRSIQPVPRLTLTPQEAADTLGISRDFFDEHVKPELRVIRRGRLVLVPWRELERWLDENAVRVLP